jgi:hypothetical protein
VAGIAVGLLTAIVVLAVLLHVEAAAWYRARTAPLFPEP